MNLIKILLVKLYDLFILSRHYSLEKKNFYLKNKRFKIIKKFEIEKFKKVTSIDKFSMFKVINFYYRPRYAYLLRSVEFSAFNSLVFDKDNFFLESSFNEGRLKREVLKKKKYKKKIESKKICSSILSGLYLNHYHMMVDVIPKILVLLEIVKKYNYKIDLYITKDFEKYFKFFLNCIDKRISVKLVDKETFIHAQKFLQLPYLSNTANGYLPYKYIKFITNSLSKKIQSSDLDNIEKKNSEKIYISRKFAKKRKLINEDKFVKFLKKKNFEIIYLEKLSIIKQYLIFNNSKIIISIHGAGLTNMIFSKPKTKIIELIPTKNKPINHYRFLSKACFHKYYSFTGNAKEKNDNFYIDIKSFKNFFYNYL